MVVVRGFFIPPGHLTEAGGNLGKRVRLTKKTRPGVLSHSNPDPGHPTSRRWKRLRPLPPKEWGVRWACLAIFFLALGLGEVCTGDAWNLLSEGTGVVFFWLVSPAEGTSALALVHFKSLHAACAYGRHVFVFAHSPHHHHHTSVAIVAQVSSIIPYDNFRELWAVSRRHVDQET